MRYLATGGAGFLGSNTVRRFSNAAASKPFPSATSIFLVRARIPVRPTPACSPNFAQRSSNTASRSFSATVGRPATSRSWTTPSTPICSLAKRPIWRAKSLILAAAGAFLSMKSWPRSERLLARLWRRNTMHRARETFASHTSKRRQRKLLRFSGTQLAFAEEGT